MKSSFIFLFLVFFLSFNVSSQEGWGFIKTQIGNDTFRKPESIIPIVDKETGNIFVLVKYKKNSKFYLFDKNSKLLREFATEEILDKTDVFIGSTRSYLKYDLYFSNDNNSKFEKLEIDFEKEELSESTLDLDIKKEYLIGSFEDKEGVYLLSILKNTSVLKLYKLDSNKGLEEIEIDLSNESFKKFNGFETSLYYLVASNQMSSRTQSSSISYNVPNSLESTSAVNKVYFHNGVISLTNDNSSRYSNLIQINAEDGSYTFNQITKRGYTKEELRSESNSFILDNFFFSAYATTTKMVFSVYDINNKIIIKEFTLTNKDTISFKNSAIIKNDGYRTRTKEPKDSGQFLRDIVNSNLGISVYKRNDLLVMSLGASEREQSAGFIVAAGMIGGALGVLLVSAFDSYVKTSSTKIDCLFDNNFNHIKGVVDKNGFDKIREFTKLEKLENAPLQTVFKHEQNYLWGYYDKNTGVYRFYKFKV